MGKQALVWSVPRDWEGQTAFIIGGGPSVSDENIEALKGRHCIAVNSSYEIAPWSEFLLFGDLPWWHHHSKYLRTFAGKVVTVSASQARDTSAIHLLRCRKVKPPPGLSTNPQELVMQKTTLQGAMNLAVHLGSNRIVLLGADMARAADGRTHHHKPHARPPKSGCWDEQMQQLRLIAEPLSNLNISVINTSMRSRIDWWERKPLTEVLAS